MTNVSIEVPAGQVVTYTSDGVAGLPDGRHAVVFDTGDFSQSLVVERAVTRTIDNIPTTSVLLGAMGNQWNAVFSPTLGQAQRSLVSELRDVRNRWAHNEPFPGGDAYRALDSIERLLAAVSAEQAEEVGQMRMDDLVNIEPGRVDSFSSLPFFLLS